MSAEVHIPDGLPFLKHKVEAQARDLPAKGLTWFFTSIDGYFRDAHPDYKMALGGHWRKMTAGVGHRECIVNGQPMTADDTWWWLVTESQKPLITDIPTHVSWPGDKQGREWLVLKVRDQDSQLVGFVFLEFTGLQARSLSGDKYHEIAEILEGLATRLAGRPLPTLEGGSFRNRLDPVIDSRTELPTVVRRFLLGRGPGEKGILARAARRLQIGLDAENAAWGDFDADAIGRLIQIMQTEGVSAATINKDHSTWRSFVEELRVEGYLTDKDVHLIKRVKLPKKSKSTSLDSKAGRAMSLEEQHTLLCSFGACEHAREARDKLVTLLLLCGLRRQELTDLKLTSLDTKRGSMPSVTVVGKGNKTRKVPLPPPVMAAVSRWLELRGSAAGPLIVAINRGGTLGTTKVSGESIRVWMRDAADRAGIQKVTPHDGRRTFISDGLAVADFGESAYLQRLAGHSSLDQTLGYDRRPEELAEELMTKITESRGN